MFKVFCLLLTIINIVQPTNMSWEYKSSYQLPIMTYNDIIERRYMSRNIVNKVEFPDSVKNKTEGYTEQKTNITLFSDIVRTISLETEQTTGSTTKTNSTATELSEVNPPTTEQPYLNFTEQFEDVDAKVRDFSFNINLNTENEFVDKNDISNKLPNKEMEQESTIKEMEFKVISFLPEAMSLKTKKKWQVVWIRNKQHHQRRNSTANSNMRTQTTEAVTCNGDLNEKGSCYSYEECHKRGGQQQLYHANQCPQPYVCCVFSYSCGEVSSESITHFRSPDFPSFSIGSLACDFDLNIAPTVCAVRFDFIKVVLAKKLGGVCDVDQLLLLNSVDGPTVAECGDLSKYSTTIAVMPGQKKPVKIALVIQNEGHYIWNIKSTQLQCSHLKYLKEPANCGTTASRQYYSDTFHPWQHSTAGHNPLPHDVWWKFPEPMFNTFFYGAARMFMNPQLQQHTAEDRIIGGTDVVSADIPWQVAIFIDNMFFCSGSIINMNFVLTAAHCFLTRDTPATGLIVFVGVHDLSNLTQVANEFRRVVKVNFHSHFHPFLFSNDIALLQLDRPLTLSNKVQPVCLPIPGDTYVGEAATVSGWGITSFPMGQPSTGLLKLQVETISNAECSHAIQEPVNMGMLCASARGLQGTCFVSINAIDLDAIASSENVRIAPSLKSQKGAIWTKSKTDFDWWEVEVIFRISGRGRIGADGLAFWYTAEKGQYDGTVLGSSDKWTGLSVMFDSFDNDNKHNNPYIMGVLNDGTREFDHTNDGASQLLAGCLRDFRNKPFPTRARIEYYQNTLTVLFHNGMTNNDQDFEVCFRAEKVFLPKHGHFGISAATGGLADDHDVMHFLTTSLHPPGQEPLGSQKLSVEEQQKLTQEYQDYQKKLELQKEEYHKEHPDIKKDKDTDFDEWFETDSQRELRQIFSGQSQMFDVLKELHRKVDEVITRQERQLSLLSQQAAVPVVPPGSPPGSPVQMIDTIRRHEVEAVLQNQNIIMNTASELRRITEEINGRSDKILQTQARQPTAQVQSVGYDMASLINEMRDGLNHIKQIVTATAARTGTTQPATSCPNCLSTTMFIVFAAIQLIIMLGYSIYRDKQEQQAKKFY